MKMNTKTDAAEADVRAAIKKRLEVMSRLVRLNTSTLNRFLHRPHSERVSGIKRDGTPITMIEYEINTRSMNTYIELFPEDGFDGEEVHMLRLGAPFTLLEDPINATEHAQKYEPTIPEVWRWATNMLSLTYRGSPVAFALGIPLKNEVYWGSIYDGVFMNGQKWNPAEGKKLHINKNKEVATTTLQDLTGYKNVHIAGVCCWLILQGHATSGISPFHLPHENSCIAAAAASLGARVTNMHGGEFQAYNERGGLVWTFEK